MSKVLSTISELTAVTREAMQNLKSVREDIHKRSLFNSIIKHIYHQALAKASSSTSRCYKEPITVNTKDYTMHVNGIPFERPQIPDILTKLRELFPDCLVEHTMLSKGQDGKLYDISKTADPVVLAFVNRQKDQAYFVIDWS